MAKSDLFIIECLHPRDYALFQSDGMVLYNIMQSMAFDSRYQRVYNKEGLKQAIKEFRQSKYTWLHVSLHGEDDGFMLYDVLNCNETTSGEKVVDKDFVELFAYTFRDKSDVQHYSSSLHQKRLTISGCKAGRRELAELLFGLPGDLTSFVGPIGCPTFIKSTCFWVSFYA